MPFEDAYRVAGIDVPLANGFVPAGAEKLLAVSRKDELIRPIRVAAEGLELSAGACIPQTHRVVLGGGGD